VFLSDLSIARPVFALMVTLALAIFGLLSLRDIGIEENPNVEFPFLSIVTAYPGADPETVETEVTDKIEESVATLAGIKNLNSTSAENVSQVSIEYELEVDIDVVAQDVRDRMARLTQSLPDSAETPVVEKFDVHAEPVLTVTVSGNLNLQDLAEYVDEIIKPRLESITGVGRVNVFGQRDREVRIWLDADKMAAQGISVQEVVSAIQRGHVEIPGGRVETGDREFLVITSGELNSVPEFKEIIVGTRHDTLIRLKDVATIEDGVEDQRSITRLNGQPTIGLQMIKKSGGNVIDVADAAYKVIDELRAEAPPGLDIQIPADNSNYTRDSYHEVQGHVVGGAIIAIVIVLLFLGNLRTTIIAALTIPTSLVTTFIFMKMFNFSLNNVTMLAFSLMVGMLIDDAIVVLENIYRHAEMGKSPMQAAREGSKEIAFAVLVTTLSIVAVFVPVAFMSGIVGRFMYQYGITVAVGVIASYFIAFMLGPMLASRFLTGKKDNFFLFYWFDRGFEKVEKGYRWLIGAALRQKILTLVIATLAMIGSIGLFALTKKEFLTNADRASTTINIELPVGTSIQSLSEYTKQIERVLEGIPEVENYLTTLGGGAFGEQYKGDIFVDLVDKKERDTTQWDIEDIIRERTADLPGGKIIVGGSGGFGSIYDIQVEISGPDGDQIQQIAEAFADRIKTDPTFMEVDLSSEAGKPEVRINIDRDRAADLGIDAASVGSTLRLLISGEDTVSTFMEHGRQNDIKVRLLDTYRDNPRDIESLFVFNEDDDQIEVSNFASVNIGSGTSQISHSNKMRSIYVNANMSDGFTVGDGKDVLEGLYDELIPTGVSARVVGEAEIMSDSFQSMAEALILAIALIYMILAAQFNHFVHPLTIMMSLPLSFIGAFGALFFTGMTVNIFSLIGVIMLMGLVTKNAILVVEFTNQLRQRGMERDEALMTAGPVRLRPVVMTALSTIGGMLPVALMIGGGAGVEMRAPMAVAVIGGLVASTFLTLIVVPVAYAISDTATVWVVRNILRIRD
jgi:HAE1 family hydrophobic/amphiphilic exporter-1